MDIDDIWKAYREARACEVADATLAMDEYGYRTVQEVGIKDPAELSLQVLDTFKRERHKAGISPRTINIGITRLRAMLAWALDRGMIEENPLAKAKPMRDPGTQGLRAFSVPEAHSLLRAADGEWKPMFQLYLCTGMRRCEALWLEWPEYDAGHGVINLPGNRTKTRAGREVYLGPRMVSIMNGIKRGNRHVFLNPRTGKRYHEHSVRTALRRYAERAGWPSMRGATPKAFRNTFITVALQLGISAADVSKLAGHQTGNLTTGLYYRPSPTWLRRETEKVERVLLEGEE